MNRPKIDAMDEDDKYWRNLALDNSMKVAAAAFDLLEKVNEVKAYLRTGVMDAEVKKRMNVSGLGMLTSFDLLYSLTRMHLLKTKLTEEDKALMEQAKVLLDVNWGGADYNRMVSTARAYFDLLIKTNMVSLTHGYEFESLGSKLNRW